MDKKTFICIRTGISIGARADAHGLLEVQMRVSASERKLFFFLLVLFFAGPANAQDLVLSGVIVTPDKVVDKGWVVIKGGQIFSIVESAPDRASGPTQPGRSGRRLLR